MEGISRNRSWYHRREVSRISADWVDANVRLTEREKELLDIIYKRKMVRRDMLEVISPSYRHLGSNRTRIINRSIGKMFENMVLDKVHEPQQIKRGNKPAILALDRAGSIVLGVTHKQRIRHSVSVSEGVKYIHRELPSNHRHVNGVNQLEVDTILFCESTNSEIVEWSIEKPIELFYGQDKITLIPDILIGLKFASKPLNAFYAYIEYDTGSESIRYKKPPIIKNKVTNYRKYMLSKSWREKFTNFPIVILITEDSKRIRFFNEICVENGLVGLGVHSSKYSDFLNKISTMA